MSPTPADWQDAHELLGQSAQFLASGATCVAFTDGEWVLRLSDPNPGKAARFNLDAQIRGKLRAVGVPTPEPLALGTLLNGRPYSLDALTLGDDSAPAAEGWADVGRALKVLHALPHSGYGLLEDHPDLLRGMAFTPANGIRTRLQQVWPFNHQPLAAHPLVWAAPDLAQPIQALHDDFFEVMQAETAVCHTDLHRNQFQWQVGRLAFIMDFGDASAFPPAWDLASVAYFHGWNVAGQVAEAAALLPGREAALLGLLLAFHRASRAQEGHPQQRETAIAFARSCLERV